MALGRRHLFLPVVFSIADVARASGATDTWFEHDYQYAHLEMWTMTALSFITVAFEAVLHFLERRIKKQETAHDCSVDGETEEEARRLVEEQLKMREFQELRKPVWLTILHRGTGELTVLGFIAFLIYVFERSKGFEKIAKGLQDYELIAVPEAAVDYFHTTEDVHIQLFLTMIVFLLIVTIAALNVSQAQMRWNEANTEAIRKIKAGETVPETPGTFSCVDESAVRSREIFLDTLCFFVGHWEALDQEIVNKLLYTYSRHHLCDVAEAKRKLNSMDSSVDAEQGDEILGSNGARTNKKQNVKELLETWFPFDEFLGLQSHLMIENMLEIKPWMWLYLICLFIISTQLIRVTKDDLFDELMLAINVVLVVVACAVMVWFVHRKVMAVRRYQESRETANHHWVGGLKVIHMVQLLVWTGCYFIMRVLVRSHLWSSGRYFYPVGKLIGLAVYIPVAGFLLGKLLRVLVLTSARGDLELQEYHLEWLTIICFTEEMKVIRKAHRA